MRGRKVILTTGPSARLSRPLWSDWEPIEREQELTTFSLRKVFHVRDCNPEQSHSELGRKLRTQQFQADKSQHSPRGNGLGFESAARDLPKVGVFDLHRHGASGTPFLPVGLPELLRIPAPAPVRLRPNSGGRVRMSSLRRLILGPDRGSSADHPRRELCRSKSCQLYRSARSGAHVIAGADRGRG
jgi:hypothetical protein